MSSNPNKKIEDLYNKIYSSMNEGVAIHRIIFNSNNIPVNYGIIDVNPAFEEILGINKKEVLGKNSSEVYGTAEPHYLEIYSKVSQTRIPTQFETYFESMDKYFNINVFSPSKGMFVTIFEDISERKKNEEKIKKSEAYYKTIFENTGTATIILEENAIISLANTEFEKLSGYSKEELEGKKSWIDLIVENEIEKVMDYHKSRISNKSAPKNYEIKLINKNTAIRDVYATVALIPYTPKSLISFLDITDKKESRKALKESQKKYRDLTELLPQSIFETNLDGDITFTNRIGLKIFGYTQEDLDSELNMLNFLDPKDHLRAMENNQRILREELSVEEYTALKKDGTTFPIFVYSNAIKHDDKVVGSRGVIVDLTDIKNIENNLKASLNEKEILLREIHHRVKNNMQIVSSLLNLQTRYVDDEKAVNVLKESQNRVRSMAIIHEKLYESENLTHINFVDYIQSLVSYLFYSYNIEKTQIKPLLKIEDISLNIETAVPCGLIISELISNSLKYAFPNGMKGEIIVSLKSEKDNYQLCICDNGIGLPEDINFNNIKTLGLLLVNSLTEQIDGKVTIHRDQGTQYKIIFKELTYKERI
jgi:PAS domain S-box-containing protein